MFNKKGSNKLKKEGQGVNAYVLIFALIIISTILTYIVPAGHFDKTTVDGRDVLVADSFKFVDNTPVGFLDIFSYIHTGMVNGAGTIFFVLIIGGVFGIINATGALDTFVVTFARKMKNKDGLIIPALMLFFGICGGTMGMSDEVAVYVALLVPLTIALGFDAVTGFAIVVVGASMGFTAGFLNPFSTGVAQQIAQLKTFSGIGYRLIIFVVFYGAAVLYVYRHAMKVKRNPELGIYGKFDRFSATTKEDQDVKMTTRHKLVLLAFMLNFVFLIIGVMRYDWYITEIAGLFLMFGIIMGIIGKLSANNIADSFVKGAGELIGGALIIGMAQTVLVVFNEGGLMDTILHYASILLNDIPGTFTAVGMMILQMGINFLVPSQSGQAALTMPIMAPLADLVGITRQTAVLAFQLGDGIAASLFPTNGALIAALAVAGIPWNKWVRWYLPFFFLLFGLSIVFLVIAQLMKYGPF
ncbi:YfcC family protein [Kurthia sibirica]|uniref:YfcC family protein n=1 Tax=Kurthia sibirica TaxID=202750 RepID=UPI00117034E4|nr:C4-dicarboxylate ABC transporter permease [Kurthia sibirica]GEK34980.1 C4-dicarboxylate ABC transporter [Kurthia sibirica]